MEPSANLALPPGNPVTFSVQKMSHFDKYAVRLLLTQLRLELEKSGPYKITVTDLAQHWGIPYADVAQAAGDVASNLLTLSISLDGPSGWTTFPWSSKLRFDVEDRGTGQAVVSVTFNEKAKNYLLEMTGHDTVSLGELLSIT